MINRPLHQNLDTSYVNLSLLVKYLKNRQFTGRIKVRLNGYDAQILINEKNRLKVREHDLISGRISDGAEAFQRLLIRSREPGGTIDVYQCLNEGSPAKTAETSKSKQFVAPELKQEIPVQTAAVSNQNHVNLPKQNGSGGFSGSEYLDSRTNGNTGHPSAKAQEVEETTPERLTSLPDFPFKLTNSVEQKAQNIGLSTEDWQLLLKLTVEILGVVDRSLSTHELDFAAAFRKARAEIAGDYPFMSPASGIFDYQNRRITMTEQVNHTVFVRSIIESLKRIFERLGGNPKFGLLYRDTTHLIIALINKRGPHYNRFGIMRPLKNILGI